MKNKTSGKILIFGNFLYLGGDPFVLLALMKSLAQKGFVITLAGPIGKAVYPFIRSLSFLHQLIPLTKDVKAFCRKIERETPDLFINSAYSAITTDIALKINRPLYSRVIGHPKWWVDPMGGSLDKARNIIRAMGLFSDRVITVSNFLKSLFTAEGFSNVDTIYEGCDTRKFFPSAEERLEFREEFNLSEKEIIFGVIAHFTWQKRHDLVLAAFARFRKKNPNFKCFFIGGSCDQEMQDREDELKTLIRKHNLHHHIIFTGFRHDMRRVINGLDIPIFPFLEEAFGMAVVESMACEKPVILNRSGSFPELIENGKEGLLVDAKNKIALSEALLKLADDPKHSRVMGTKGRLRVKRKFSFERHLKAHLTLIKQLIQKNNSPHES